MTGLSFTLIFLVSLSASFSWGMKHPKEGYDPSAPFFADAKKRETPEQRAISEEILKHQVDLENHELKEDAQRAITQRLLEVALSPHPSFTFQHHYSAARTALRSPALLPEEMTALFSLYLPSLENGLFFGEKLPPRDLLRITHMVLDHSNTPAPFLEQTALLVMRLILTDLPDLHGEVRGSLLKELLRCEDRFPKALSEEIKRFGAEEFLDSPGMGQWAILKASSELHPFLKPGALSHLIDKLLQIEAGTDSTFVFSKPSTHPKLPALNAAAERSSLISRYHYPIQIYHYTFPIIEAPGDATLALLYFYESLYKRKTHTVSDGETESVREQLITALTRIAYDESLTHIPFWVRAQAVYGLMSMIMLPEDTLPEEADAASPARYLLTLAQTGEAPIQSGMDRILAALLVIHCEKASAAHQEEALAILYQILSGTLSKMEQFTPSDRIDAGFYFLYMKSGEDYVIDPAKHPLAREVFNFLVKIGFAEVAGFGGEHFSVIPINFIRFPVRFEKQKENGALQFAKIALQTHRFRFTTESRLTAAHLSLKHSITLRARLLHFLQQIANGLDPDFTSAADRSTAAAILRE